MLDRDRFSGRPPAWLAAPLLPPDSADAPLVLRDVDLRCGQFGHAFLRDVDLQRANLAEADLAGADLRGANLHLADLTLADLRGADLRGADLSQADLSGADLRDADLGGADLRDVELSWAWLDGVRGAPDAWMRIPRLGGRVPGRHRAAGEDEPIEGLRAFQRAQAAWKEGNLGVAERAYETALRWVPDSDAARYFLGALALERAEPDAAIGWWRAALAVHAGAHRARADLALLLCDAGQAEEALALLREPSVAEVAWLVPLADTIAAGDAAAAIALVRAKAGNSPGCTWASRERAAVTVKPRWAGGGPDDPAWAAQERTELAALCSGGQQPIWVWHGAVSRALAIGAIDLAQHAEQRLQRLAPDQRLWSLQLKQLDMTAQAFSELVRTRWGNLGSVESLRWVALGAHGPTARLVTQTGVYYAKRYMGVSRPAGSVAFTHRVCRFMADAGVSVPLAMPDASGDDVMVFGEDLLALYPDLQGAPIDAGDLDTAGAALLGTQLAQLHLAGAQFGGGGRPRGGVRSGSHVLRNPSPRGAWLAWHAQDAACAAALQRHPVHERILALLDATARRLASVLPHCAVGLVHGDFAGGNVLLRQDLTVAVVDWDLSDVDVLVWDLARCLDLIGLYWHDDVARPLAIRNDLVIAAVRAYEVVRPLSHAERLALPVLMAASRVDLDATVLPLCVRLEPDCGDPVWRLQAVRLARAAAGAPEIAKVLAVMWPL